MLRAEPQPQLGGAAGLDFHPGLLRSARGEQQCRAGKDQQWNEEMPEADQEENWRVLDACLALL